MKKKTMQLLLLFLFMTLGVFLKATPAQAASYVDCSAEERTKAGSYYIWIDSEAQTIMYAKSKKAAGKVLVEPEDGRDILPSCLSDGKTLFYLEFDENNGRTYIYKYSISKRKKTLLKKTWTIDSLLGCYSKTLYMQSGNKLLALNVSTHKMKTLLSYAIPVYGMNKNYVIYGKTTSGDATPIYSYNLSTKKKTRLFKTSSVSLVTVENGRVYYLKVVKKGTEANDYVNTYVLKSCSFNGKTTKTLSGEIQGKSAMFNGASSTALEFIIGNSVFGGDGTDEFYSYEFSTGKLSKVSY